MTTEAEISAAEAVAEDRRPIDINVQFRCANVAAFIHSHLGPLPAAQLRYRVELGCRVPKSIATDKWLLLASKM